MAHMFVEVPGGEVGDVEAALRKSGLGVLDSAELAEHIITSAGASFDTKKLGKAGIDAETLARELRAAGLIVRWTGEVGPAA